MTYGEFLNTDCDLLKKNNIGNLVNVTKNSLSNKSVALYFASYENAKCRSFTPFLLQFYKSINSSSKQDKIEVIFVSLDKDEQRFLNYTKDMPWIIVNYNGELRKHLIKRYDVREDSDEIRPGYVPATDLPKLVVVGENGEKLSWLTCDNHSQTILREWDFHASKWS